MSFAVPITLKERIQLMEGVDITNCMQGDLESENSLAKKRLKEFVNENYELVRELRENPEIHEKFERQLQKIYDAMLDLLFKLQ